MCKRSVERLLNEPKKRRNPQYTQGPLDDQFGQHRAFPIDPNDADEGVIQYLADVRKEAEEDRPVHYVNRRAREPAYVAPRKFSELSLKYIESVIDRLRKQKQLQEKEEAEVAFVLNDIEVDAETAMAPEIPQASQVEVDDEPTELEKFLQSAEIGQETEEAQSIESASRDQLERALTDSTEEATEEKSQTEEQTDSDTDSDAQIVIPLSAGEWRTLIFSQSPPEGFHDALEHPTVIKLIIYYTKWLLVSMPSTLLEWMFATFVRLDNGLEHTEMALVRELGKKARKLRTKFRNGAQEGAVIPQEAQDAVNMVLAVIGHYYGQRDLLTDE